jgi:hypothetical protein
LRLIFPQRSYKASQRTQRLSEHDGVDLEVGIEKHASLELENYPIWGDRLAAIQRRYDAARPRYIEQWYYDRRNRDQWATLWIAVIIFFLTVIFGVISSITGIMQVYAAWHFQNASIAT